MTETSFSTMLFNPKKSLTHSNYNHLYHVGLSIYFHRISVSAYPGYSKPFNFIIFQMDLDLFSLDTIETGDQCLETPVMFSTQMTSPNFTDRESVSEKSPSHSDSGVSLDCPTDSPSGYSEEQYGSSGSPGTLTDPLSQGSPLGLDYFNFDDTTFDTTENNALLSDTEILNQLNANFSIDLGKSSICSQLSLS